MKHLQALILIILLITVAVWINLPNNPGIHIGNFNREISTRLGLDLVGGVQVLLEADIPEGSTLDKESMQAATTIVENRVNALGVNEAIVQQAGDRRVVVEIPGIQNPEQAITTIRETGLLEFVHMGTNPLLEGIVVKTDFGQSPENSAVPTSTPDTSPSTDSPSEVTSTESPELEKPLHTVMTGAVIKTVQVTTDNLGKYIIEFTLTDEGAKLFSDYTSQNVGQFLGIVLDKRVISAPQVNEAITEGEGIITGSFTLESANKLAVQLRYGSLPIPLKVVETRTIGPTLGEDSLRKSLLAGGIGFSIVILFMALYYRLPGGLADISIIIYALVTFAIFRFIPVTLTLPGIAGLMLSTGSALDANILIFERLKEELRSGRTLRQAVDLAWQRAWPSIRDSNISTIITSGILFWFGSAFGASIVKGFSLTLAIGVAVSLFSAIIVTRTLLNLVLVYLQQVNLRRWFGI